MAIDKSTVIGWGLDELSKLGDEFRKFIFSDKGIALISGIFTGTGLGAAVATKKGRETAAKAWTTVKTTIAKSAKEGSIKSVKGFAAKVAKVIATKVGHGLGAVGCAIVAGYVTGLTFGDYFKSDAKNFWQQFGQDLALNLAAGPVASAVKHVIINKDMVVEDINNKVIKPIGKELKKFGQWIGIIPKDNTNAQRDTKALSIIPISNDPAPVESGAYTEKRRREIVEYEKGKRSLPSKTTNDHMVEFMKQNSKTNKSFKNDSGWYFQGLAAKLLSTTLTWTGLKDHTSDYHFVPAAVIHVSLMLPTDSDRKLHHQVIANTNIEWQALRGKNTGAFNYTEEDVYTYNTTLASLIAVARFTGKLLNMVNKHDPEVELLPQALLAGYACNYAARTNTGQIMYDDIIANRPQYLSQLNDICKEINTYALKGKTLISRWNYIADKCFRDYDGEKAVYGYYALRQVPSLTTTGIGVTNLENLTIPQLITYMKAQLDLIRTYKNGDLLRVAGDEIKLLGASASTFANVPYFTGNEVYEFKYDPEAYDQIRNAKVIPWGVAQQPSYDRSVAAQYSASLVSTTNINPRYLGLIQDEYEVVSERNKQFEAKENLQMIQFIPNVSVRSTTPSTTINLDIDDCPTTTMDIVVITLYDRVNGGIDTDVYTSIISDYNTASSPDIKVHGTISTQHSNAQGTAWMQEIGQIDFMPRYQIWKGDYSADFQATVIDVDNFAYVTAKQVTQLNNVAVYSQTFVFNPEDLKIMGILVG